MSGLLHGARACHGDAVAAGVFVGEHIRFVERALVWHQESDQRQDLLCAEGARRRPGGAARGFSRRGCLSRALRARDVLDSPVPGHGGACRRTPARPAAVSVGALETRVVHCGLPMQPIRFCC